ncbi:hypothetical protein CEXT_388121 [Caerostris extrusa]|uniref:Uncharacterized protein n=1 Tax=Caerostris extrusa TaxID=172846 RepID=A0AAV4NMG3_CAEEX|nr:hypothetical protein CEXT_388121 [Caerostris extrusa]
MRVCLSLLLFSTNTCYRILHISTSQSIKVIEELRKYHGTGNTDLGSLDLAKKFSKAVSLQRSRSLSSSFLRSQQIVANHQPSTENKNSGPPQEGGRRIPSPSRERLEWERRRNHPFDLVPLKKILRASAFFRLLACLDRSQDLT